MRLYGAVMMGGALGAVLRSALLVGPWATMGINGVGCLLLGVWSQVQVREDVKVGVGTGVLGGLTTFSTFSVDMLKMVQDGAWGALAGYAAGSLIGGVALAGAGVFVGRKFFRQDAAGA